MSPEEWSVVLAGELSDAERSVALLALSDEDWVQERWRDWLRGKAADPDGFRPAATTAALLDGPQLREGKYACARPSRWWWIDDTWPYAGFSDRPNKFRGSHDCNTCVVPKELVARMTGTGPDRQWSSDAWLRQYAGGEDAWLSLLHALAEVR